MNMNDLKSLQAAQLIASQLKKTKALQFQRHVSSLYQHKDFQLRNQSQDESMLKAQSPQSSKPFHSESNSLKDKR